MSNVTVRVELHGVAHDAEKYTQLHAEMAKRGFLQIANRLTTHCQRS